MASTPPPPGAAASHTHTPRGAVRGIPLAGALVDGAATLVRQCSTSCRRGLGGWGEREAAVFRQQYRKNLDFSVLSPLAAA